MARTETRDERVHAASAVLDIGEDIGALVIYTPPAFHGLELEVSPLQHLTQRIHTAVLARQVNGRAIYAALFLALAAGDYLIWADDPRVARTVTISGGAVAEVDWRKSAITPAAVISTKHPHEHADVQPSPNVPLDMLPARYRTGQAVCTTPMGSAPLRYAPDGQVAWDEMWTTYCDLALAGGPPHRDTLLEAATATDALADPANYARIVAEIQRGLALVTGRTTMCSDPPGWVGLVCLDQEMAYWLTIAISTENVRVCREGLVLWLPAGPAFRVEYEIKNVITVVAKTHHYWMEHRIETSS